VLTERGGLLVFGGTRFQPNSVHPYPVWRPRLLGGNGAVEGDDIRMLVGGIESWRWQGARAFPCWATCRIVPRMPQKG